MKLKIREQTCHLLAEKAVYWEEEKALILADIHIGKGTVFRKAGIPIPQGIMDDDLLNITNLINRYEAKKCIIVGDLIHAPKGISEEIKNKFSAWLQQTKCEVHLVLGNHDRALIKHLPAEWPLQLHQESLLIEPFYFSHFPQHHEKWFVWSGHLHPKVEIRNHSDRVVLRCFQLFSDVAVLPAFGFFVGGTFVKKRNNDCLIYVIADDVVLKI